MTGPVRKSARSRTQRLVRLLLSALDPRAWAHAVKIVNYYNYSHVAPLRRIRRGADVAISPNATFANPDNIVIGDRLALGARCALWAGPGSARIVIGDDVLFAPGVMVTAANYRFNDGRPVSGQAMDEADIVIGDDVWIGANAVILPGATIGTGAIVGAGSVVTGVVAPFTIVAGAPARVVGQRQPWDEETPGDPPTP